MDKEKLFRSYLPMTETAFYILLSLSEPRHGYGIAKFVSELTKDRIKLGSGTIYGTLTKMQRDGMIAVYDDSDKRISYEITELGKELLRAEMERIKKVFEDMQSMEHYFREDDKA
ncbi:MAG: PadR family transcriptional regulator [Oscillospiraceae bacterium]|nr:PadR family transcriptional regulator [Oscillospiraceae bacterium]